MEAGRQRVGPPLFFTAFPPALRPDRAAIMFTLTRALADSAATPTDAVPLVQGLVFDKLHLRSRPAATVIYDIIIVATVFIGLASVVAMFGIWWERKVAGHIQSRFGPNRVGPIGLLQSIADGAKLLLKEDLVPADADRVPVPARAVPGVRAGLRGVPGAAVRAGTDVRAAAQRRRLLGAGDPERRGDGRDPGGVGQQ